ncbi:hypothetical protein B0H14DRAFT_3566896 [Mycena olivaceomarginata]|nr:hypothetical protein B0H14DRAFT_3566896 [Mycena olivaceomarginata]
MGVFPMSPTKPQTGVSIDLLDIYRALFERSCEAITALSAALHTIYDRRGFHVLSSKNPGQLAKDPFRAGLQQAVQWYRNLRTRIQKKVDCALAAADASLFPPVPAPIAQSATDVSAASAAPSDVSAAPTDTPADQEGAPATPLTTPNPIPAGNSASESQPGQPALTPGRADRILRERCPACFNLEEWGRPLREGGDVQLGADGCFSYRHSRKAGDEPISYDPAFFLSKEKVDAVRDRIAKARKKQPAKCNPPIPEEVIDACGASWDAANEKKQKVDAKCHDASGVFVMTCRHSQVLFQCNIDTPGEQQQYIVACLEEVNSLLPPQATVVQAYDVGCVTDHSLNLQNSRRIWMLDQYAVFVNEDGCSSLGDWILRQREKNITKKSNAAMKVIQECRVSVEELRCQWELQKAAQTSICAHAPVRLRHELDKVLALQTQIDAVEQSIIEVKKSITGANTSSDSLGLHCGLKTTQYFLYSGARIRKGELANTEFQL